MNFCLAMPTVVPAVAADVEEIYVTRCPSGVQILPSENEGGGAAKGSFL